MFCGNVNKCNYSALRFDFAGKNKFLFKICCGVHNVLADYSGKVTEDRKYKGFL